MKRARFFENLVPILAFAFIGTLITAAITGYIVYLASEWRWINLPLTGVECFLLGSILGATDPVAIIASFRALDVNPSLTALVTGESVLNDAVAIVLYRIILNFAESTGGDIEWGLAVGQFAALFALSILIGLGFGIIASLFTKHVNLSHNPTLETIILALPAYSAYLLAEGLNLSGIVALLFAAITITHYAANNLTPEGLAGTGHAFSVLGELSESFVFMLLGAALVVFDTTWVWSMILVTLSAVLVARAVMVFGLSGLLNCCKSRNSSSKISGRVQTAVWYSGLRGAVAFGLALEIPFVHEDQLRTTILAIVLFSVVIMGGGASLVMESLGIAKESPEDDAVSKDSTEMAEMDGAEQDGNGEAAKTKKKGFVGFDRRWIKPMLTRYKPHTAVVPLKDAAAAHGVSDLNGDSGGGVGTGSDATTEPAQDDAQPVALSAVEVDTSSPNSSTPVGAAVEGSAVDAAQQQGGENGAGEGNDDDDEDDVLAGTVDVPLTP